MLISCEIVLEEMQLPPMKRRCSPPRTLQGILESHNKFVATGGNKKHVKHFLNCLTEPIFGIPITQVCMHWHLCAIITCIIQNIMRALHNITGVRTRAAYDTGCLNEAVQAAGGHLPPV